MICMRHVVRTDILWITAITCATGVYINGGIQQGGFLLLFFGRFYLAAVAYLNARRKIDAGTAGFPFRTAEGDEQGLALSLAARVRFAILLLICDGVLLYLLSFALTVSKLDVAVCIGFVLLASSLDKNGQVASALLSFLRTRKIR